MNPALDYRARELVRSAAQVYLSPTFDTSTLPNIDGLAKDQRLRLSFGDYIKICRYSVAAAGIHLLMQEAISGSGQAAQFADGPAVMVNERFPIAALEKNIDTNVNSAAARLRHSKDSLYGYLMYQYDRFGKADEHNSFFTGNSRFIDDGGTLGFNGAQFVGLSAVVLATTEETRLLDTPERVAIVHELTPTVTGDASQHISYRPSGPNWRDYTAANTHLARRGKQHALQRNEGGSLFRTPQGVADRIERYGPLLKCPAHQLLFSDATSLQLGLHAVVNLGDARGLYEPEMAPILALSIDGAKKDQKIID